MICLDVWVSMESDQGIGGEMVGKEWSREVIKIWCEFLGGKDKFKYRDGGIWEVINGGKGDSWERIGFVICKSW